jgi:Flp pilus assembly CpaE family ATPase
LVRRCLDADDLLASVNTRDVDAAIVSADLHGLGADAVRALAQVPIPIVLWGVNAATGPDAPSSGHVTIMPRDVDIAELRDAIRALGTAGGRLRRPRAPTASLAQLEQVITDASGARPPSTAGAMDNGTVIALVGAPGGNGVSLLAAGLTAALGRKASAALVDLNLEHPSQVLTLDLNPARNLYMVLHEAAARDDASLWARLLESELQSLDGSIPRAAVLAGAPGAGVAGSITADGVHRLLRELARHEQFVVADVGSTLEDHTPVAAGHRAALEAADRVFVVARADLVGLRRAAQLLEYLRGNLDRHADRLALVLNQHRAQYHHDAVEVVRAFRTRVVAVVPDDPRRTQAALAAQRPLVAFGGTRRGSAGRALLALARSIEDAAVAEPARASTRQPRFGFAWRPTLWPVAWEWRRS